MKTWGFRCDKIEKVQADGGAIPPGMTREDVWNAKYIYDSAYHPTTGELVFMPGRMSFQGKNSIILTNILASTFVHFHPLTDTLTAFP